MLYSLKLHGTVFIRYIYIYIYLYIYIYIYIYKLITCTNTLFPLSKWLKSPNTCGHCIQYISDSTMNVKKLMMIVC